MSQIVFFLRPSDEVSEYAQNAVSRFQQIQQASLQLILGKSVNEVASQIEAGQVAMIFNESPLQKTEINLLAQCYSTSKKKPFFVLDDSNYETVIDSKVLASNPMPKELICKAKADFSEAFIFNCIRNLLTPPGQKLDIRYIKSIVSSAGEVISKNTFCQLNAEAIFEDKAKEAPEEVAMVSAIYGDGFLGSITIGTEYKLMNVFTQKMLYCDESDVTKEMVMDLSAELSNQILGVMRNSLGEFGWKLSTTMQVVVIGDNVLNSSASNGRYYHMPFTYEGMKFFISLCYNTYQTSINEIEEEFVSHGSSGLDIRLVNGFRNSFTRIVTANLGESAVFEHEVRHLSSIYQQDSLHLLHVGSWQAHVTIGLEVPRELSEAIMAKMGMGPQDVDDTVVNDYWGELINQIGGDFLKSAESIGYKFKRVYHGEFSGRNFQYMMRMHGQYFRQKVKLGEHSLYLFFGTSSCFPNEFADVWPYFMAQSEFVAV